MAEIIIEQFSPYQDELVKVYFDLLNAPNNQPHFYPIFQERWQLELYLKRNRGYVGKNFRREVVGFATLADYTEEPHHLIEKVVVSDPFRNQGIGRDFVGEVINKAFTDEGLREPRNDLTARVITGVSGWEYAQRMFLRLGFVSLGVTGQAPVEISGVSEKKDVVSLQLLRENWNPNS